MVDAGFPAAKMCTKPNFFPGRPDVVDWGRRDNAVVFVGRLSVEKGLETLVEAWRLWGESAPELRLIGAGPLRDKLMCAARGACVRFLGQLSSAATHEEIAKAKLLMLPSQCFEAFPMVIPEAFAYGVPVGVSSLGPLPDIVNEGRTGVVFAPRDAQQLLHRVSQSWKDDQDLARMGRAARTVFDAEYSEEVNYRRLMAIYAEVLAGNDGAQ